MSYIKKYVIEIDYKEILFNDQSDLANKTLGEVEKLVEDSLVEKMELLDNDFGFNVMLVNENKDVLK